MPVAPFNLCVIWMIYLDSGTNPKTEFHHFMHILNSHHPRIKLKHTLHLQQVPFLDTIVFFTEAKDGHKTLATKVYFKDTDRHSLLFNTRYHPRHTFSSIIKSQLIRFHRICSLPHHVEEATRTLFKALRPRGYSKRFLCTIKGELTALFQSGRPDLPGKKNNTEERLIPFITTFSRQLGPLNETIKTTF